MQFPLEALYSHVRVFLFTRARLNESLTPGRYVYK